MAAATKHKIMNDIFLEIYYSIQYLLDFLKGWDKNSCDHLVEFIGSLVWQIGKLLYVLLALLVAVDYNCQ